MFFTMKKNSNRLFLQYSEPENGIFSKLLLERLNLNFFSPSTSKRPEGVSKGMATKWKLKDCDDFEDVFFATFQRIYQYLQLSKNAAKTAENVFLGLGNNIVQKKENFKRIRYKVG